MTRNGTILCTLLLALACGGLGPGVSEQTRKLGEVLTQEGDPDPDFGHVGQEVVLGDLSFEFDTPFVAPVNFEALLWGHRPNFQGHQALFLPFRVRNDTPIAAPMGINREMYDALGQKVYPQPSLTEDGAKQLGRIHTGAGAPLPPGKWVESVWVFALEPDEIGANHVHLWETETRKHPATGRKYDVTLHRTLVELDAPLTTPPVAIRAKSFEEMGGGSGGGRRSRGR